MKKSIITTLLILVTLAANAAIPDSIQQKLVDYDYLTSFTEKNYATFPAIMEQGFFTFAETLSHGFITSI